MLQSTEETIIEKIKDRIKSAEEYLSEIKRLIIVIRDPPARPKVIAELIFVGAQFKGAIVKTTKITIEGQPAAVEQVTAKIRELWPIAYESKDTSVGNPAGDVRRWLRVHADNQNLTKESNDQ